MHYSTSTLLTTVLGASSALAHMKLTFPPPFKGTNNPFAGQDIDYSMTAPLMADGSDYPCKGYQSLLGTSAGAATASFAAGAKGNITVEGGAAHGGGSCQISMSTDGAKTFTVIQSIIGNCPVQPSGNFDFTMPADAPSGDAVLAWSWNNQIGNREFYMNCAAITVTPASAKAKREHVEKRVAAFSTRPAIFVANIGNGCSVAEGKDVLYPDPGPDVENTSSSTEDPTGSCGASSGSSGSGSSGSSSGSSSSAGSDSGAASSTVSATTATSASAPGGVFVTESISSASSSTVAKPTTLATVTSAASARTKSASATKSAATPTASSTTGSGTTTSGSGVSIAVGSVCTNEGEWNCVSGLSFQRCASGTWSAVQQMAAGMSCTAGASDTLSMVVTARRGRRSARRAVYPGSLIDAREATTQEE